MSQDRSDDKLQRIVEELAETWNRRDGKSFSRLFAEDADYVTGSGVRLTGRVQIQDALFRRAADSVHSGTVSIMTQSIKTLGPGAAVILCTWRMGPGEGRSGFVTIVAQRAGDRWHIIALQNTDRARSAEDQSDA